MQGNISTHESRKFCQRWSNFDNAFISVYEGREDPYAEISGTSSTRQQNAIQMVFRMRVDDGLTLGFWMAALAL